ISGPEPESQNRFNRAELRIWDYRTGEPVSPPILFSGGRPRMYRIRYQVFSPDGQKVVTIQTHETEDRKTISEVILCDVHSGQNVLPPLKHEGVVSHVAFSSNGKYLVSASTAGTARVWDLEQGGIPTIVLTHAKWVTTASFSPDNQRLVTGSFDKTARIWDVHTGAPVGPILQHGRFLFDAQFSH